MRIVHKSAHPDAKTDFCLSYNDDAHPDTEVVFGTEYNDALDDELFVTVIASGDSNSV